MFDGYSKQYEKHNKHEGRTRSTTYKQEAQIPLYFILSNKI